MHEEQASRHSGESEPGHQIDPDDDALTVQVVCCNHDDDSNLIQLHGIQLFPTGLCAPIATLPAYSYLLVLSQTGGTRSSVIVALIARDGGLSVDQAENKAIVAENKAVRKAHKKINLKWRNVISLAYSCSHSYPENSR